MGPIAENFRAVWNFKPADSIRRPELDHPKGGGGVGSKLQGLGDHDRTWSHARIFLFGRTNSNQI